MARTPDLLRFAERHRLRLATISDLIAYRLRHDRIVERTLEATIDTLHGGAFRILIYVNRVEYVEHVALVKGDLSADGPVLVRMHALNVLDDVLADLHDGKADELAAAMRMIASEGRGVLVLLRDPHRTSLSERLQARLDGRDEEGSHLRDYGIGAQILLDLGVRDMVLLSNTRRTIIGLQGYGLEVAGQRPIATGRPLS
jgi:3,4-dihydroxy 2-butanone 4-phosphate synthase/GTP cyclohydrolase II